MREKHGLALLTRHCPGACTREARGRQGDFHHYLLLYRLSFWGDFSARPRLETIELMCAFCRRGSAVHVFMGVNNRSSDHHGYGLGEQSENPDFSGTLPEILS